MNTGNMAGMPGGGMPGGAGFGMGGANGGAPSQASISPQNLRAFLIGGFARSPVRSGWQATVSPEQRAGTVVEIVTALRMAKQDVVFGASVKAAVNIEAQKFTTLPSKVRSLHVLACFYSTRSSLTCSPSLRSNTSPRSTLTSTH